jgi:transcription initiation factor TFIID subunit TAF12
VIEKHNALRLKREQLEGFEADEIVPPMPRSKPKKKAKSKKAVLKKKSIVEKDNDEKEVKSIPSKANEQDFEETAVNAHIWGKR